MFSFSNIHCIIYSLVEDLEAKHYLTYPSQAICQNPPDLGGDISCNSQNKLNFRAWLFPSNKFSRAKSSKSWIKDTKELN